jgi:hypothetical protein
MGGILWEHAGDAPYPDPRRGTGKRTGTSRSAWRLTSPARVTRFDEALANLAEAVGLYLEEVDDPAGYITTTPLVTSFRLPAA